MSTENLKRDTDGQRRRLLFQSEDLRTNGISQQMYLVSYAFQSRWTTIWSLFTNQSEISNRCSWDDHESNLPITLVRFLNGQAKEIARKCVEAPLRVDASKRPFQAQPSFRATLKFLIDATVDFHIELCPICKAKCLPSNADCIETNDTEDQYIERVYCGHLFHQECLKRYMREPPFPAGGKLCPARKLHPRSDKIGKFIG